MRLPGDFTGREKLPDDSYAKELATVCYMYYRRGYRQKEIAERVGRSSATVCRMLKEARDRGIVDFQINVPCSLNLDVGRELLRRFPDLEDCLVVDDELLDTHNTATSLGQIAALYFPFFVTRGVTVGVGAGMTLAGLVRALHWRPRFASLTVVQLTGLTGQAVSPESAACITQELSGKLGAKGYFCMVPNPAPAAQTLGRETGLESLPEATTRQWPDVDVALVGLGQLNPGWKPSSFDYLGEADLAALRQKGAVGDLLLHFFDIRGHIVDSAFDKSVASISWESFKRISMQIAVAGGVHKSRAILGALRAGVIKVLITDREAAIEVCRLACLPV